MATDLSNPYNVYGNLFGEIEELDEIDKSLGFARCGEGPPRVGWLINMHSTLVRDAEWAGGRSAVDLYFIQDDGTYFKSTLVAPQYMYILCEEGCLHESEEFLRKRLDSLVEKIELVSKEDMDLPNHLTGLRRDALKLVFRNVNDLAAAKKALQPIIHGNAARKKTSDVYEHLRSSRRAPKDVNYADFLIEMREHDIPVHLRIAIDYGIRVGLWYAVTFRGAAVELAVLDDKHVRPDPVVLAFDIETTKQPLKFPDASFDQIMMISYMIDGQGFLITNREVVSQDIEDFDYSPKPEYQGPFVIFNEPNEENLLIRFFEHVQSVRPTIFVTYNGDFFDWPFIDRRAAAHGIELKKVIGFGRDSQDEYKSRYGIHMDAFKWVKRDSYLPAGSHGLKAVASVKLGYDPIELDPELMVEYAQTKPQVLASYSVSDAVATYFLYLKYVHPFIFSLCNIIPLNPDEVLRKGSGTLCETLLMAKAFSANILMPNKSSGDGKKFHKGHLLESETYVGGHVEALESGVFRSDIPATFRLSSDALQRLVDELDGALRFYLNVEAKQPIGDVVNFDEVKGSIADRLHALKASSDRLHRPSIYHLDVAAMYPNIILTNRLQPHALVPESTCAACDFNKPGKTCQRKMDWSWRGEFYTAKKNEYKMIVHQLESERFKNSFGRLVFFNELSAGEKSDLVDRRLSLYCRKVYKKIHDSEVVTKTSIVCQKENSFYIDTVRSFRDRRYDYKGLHKVWKGRLDKAIREGNSAAAEECKKMNILYDSLQLAHKCILNSFYGYVMRKGARWFSLEMAGIVCETGSRIIQLARQLIEKIGRPLELDTDGIWCMLPESFPDRFDFELRSGKKQPISYLCIILNHLIHSRFTNDQYHVLSDPATNGYDQISENSIFFEIDGPYHAMILPASTEEDRLLKKRYAVFNFNGSIAELKGFEVKRRGELKLVKIFQSCIFKTFLNGSTLQESYESAARVVNYWLDILHSKGDLLNLSELFDLVSENRNMSKTVEEYGDRKSTSICTAKRLAEFLGDEMVRDKGLSCRYVISAKPVEDPVASRAVPIAIFSAEPHVRQHYLRKWLRDPLLNDFDIRGILDWSYYLERFESVVQKLITIPAAIQGLSNPIPRVKQPSWVLRKFTSKHTASRAANATQQKISQMFAAKPCAGREPATAEARHGIDLAQSLTLEEPADFKSLLANDYVQYVARSRQRWAKLRSDVGSLRSTGGARLLSAFNAGMVGEPWQVTGILETNVPGVFKFVVSLGRRGLAQVKVRVPRRFYINSRVPDILPGLRRVYLRMPRCFRPFFLYEYSVSESEFVSDINLETFKSHPDIDAIYESLLPLQARALISIGDCCRVAALPAGSNLSHQYELADVESLNPADNVLVYSSLAPVRERFDVCLLYEVGDVPMNRQLFVLISSSQCLIAAVDPTGNKSVPALKSLVTLGGCQTFDIQNLDAQSVVFKTAQPALKSLSRFLADIKASSGRPLLLLTKTHNEVDMRPFADATLCKFDPSPTRNEPLPPIDWQRNALKRFADFLALFDTQLGFVEALSRYSHVPFINLCEAKDPLGLASDVIFSRALKDSNHVLWYSATDGSDLGGRESDWYLENTNENTSDIYFNKQDFYRTVCFDIDIANLYLDTVLASSHINEFENCASDDALDNGSYRVNALIEKRILRNLSLNVSLSDNQHSKSAFSVLKAILSGQCREASSVSDSPASFLLKNFDSWISNPSSCLYDSLLLGRIKNLAKKVVLQLMAVFRENGADVVFGTCERLVVACRKTDPESALEWVNYVIQTVKSSDLFLWLHLSISSTFQSLMWYDNVNHMGTLFGSDGYGGSFSLFQDYDGSPAIRNGCVNFVADYKKKFATPTQDHEVVGASFSSSVFDFLHQIGSVHGTKVAVDVAKRLLVFLGADQQFYDYHLRLKRSACHLLGISEFNTAASFSGQDTGHILVGDFVCPSCFGVSTLSVSVHELPRCIRCHESAAIKPAVEMFLVRHANDLLCQFYTQDFSCAKCRKIKVATMDLMCKCSGSYDAAVLPGEQLRTEMEMLRSISRLREMDHLSGFLESFPK